MYPPTGLALTPTAIAAASLLVALVGLTRAYWEPTLSLRSAKGRKAADELLAWIRDNEGEVQRPEMLSTSVPTVELRTQWVAAYQSIKDDLPPAVRVRAEVFDELLAHAERLGLRRSTGWIGVAVVATLDLRRACARAGVARRTGPSFFPDGPVMRKAIQEGQLLQTGVEPLSEVVTRTARGYDDQLERRRLLGLALSAALFGVSITILVSDRL